VHVSEDISMLVVDHVICTIVIMTQICSAKRRDLSYIHNSVNKIIRY